MTRSDLLLSMLFLGTAKNVVHIWKDLNLLCTNDFKTIQQRILLVNVPVDVGRIPYKIDTGTVFIRIVAAATINFALSFVRLLIEGGSYSRVATITARQYRARARTRNNCVRTYVYERACSHCAMNIINRGYYSRAALISCARAMCGYYSRAATIRCAATIRINTVCPV